MSRRKKPEARCDSCRLRLEQCLCAEIGACRARLAAPGSPLSTRVLLLMHYKEERLPTNTGRLAVQALPGAELRQRGRQGETAPLELVDPAAALLLYPSDDAVVLDEDYVKRLERPVTLIVPDGSWRQASKMPQREPALRALPRVRLELGSRPSRYFLRDEPKAEGLATFEAIARVLGALDGREVQRELEDLFEQFVARTLAARGAPPPPPR